MKQLLRLRKSFILVAGIALEATPAFAEVCDKERPNWLPMHGRVTSLDEMFFVMPSSFGLFVLLLLISACLGIRNRWIVLTSSTILIFIAAAHNGNAWFDPIIRASIVEGCRGTPEFFVYIFLLGAVSLMWISAIVEKRRSRKPDNGSECGS